MITTTFVMAAIDRKDINGETFAELIGSKGLGWATFDGTTLVGLVVKAEDEPDVALADAKAVPLTDDLCEQLHDAIDQVSEITGLQAHAYLGRWTWAMGNWDAEEPTSLIGIPDFESCRVRH